MSDDSLIGQRLANFKVERILGRGGMAEVYFGRDVSLQRPVAIKVIDARFRSDPGYAERFISEARAVATWRHENIVQVYYAGKSNDLYYFVMEYIDGMDLATLLREYADAGELIPHSDVIHIGKAIASSLDYAHARNVIHRDVKPANVMTSSEDRVVLMDFGLALDTRQGSIGEVLGTPHYVSPEQARRSADAVPQSDVYSLGVMLYEMLTGVVPFDDPSPTAVALQHLSVPPPPPRSLNQDLSQQVEDVLLKALEKDPTARYQTAMELVTALEEALSHKSEILSTAELPPLPPGMTPPNRSMSGQTIAERVALNVREQKTHSSPSVPRVTATKRTKQQPTTPPPQPVVSQDKPRSAIRGLVVLVPVILLLAVAGGVALLSGSGKGVENEEPTVTVTTETPTDTSAVAAEPTETEILPTPTLELPTTTDAPPTVMTIPPTVTDELPTATPIPPTSMMVASTATNITPTFTSVPPTATPIPPTVPPEPTVLYPNGRRVVLIWNNHSFYWLNPEGSSVRVTSITFEAMDSSGNLMGYTLSGSRWTLGYSSVEPGRCVSVEILQTSDWLRPTQCGGYNSQLTFRESSDEVFWLARDNASQFRVLWDGQEVGRCTIAEQTCEVRIP